MNSFAAIDFETANPKRCSICSVGIVIVRNGVIVDKIYRLIHPIPDYYNHWNVAVHGLTDKDTATAPTFPEVWSEVRKAIQGLPLVAHNCAFDKSCLKAAFKAYEMDYPDYPFYCTYRTTKQLLGDRLPNYKLNTVADYFGFDLRKHHHALADAEACAHIALNVF